MRNLLSVVVLCVVSNSSFALSCLMQDPDISVAVSKAYESSDHIVAALANHEISSEDPRDLSMTMTEFSLVSTWKGELPSSFIVFYGPNYSNSPVFQHGSIYLLYLSEDGNGEYVTNPCSRTALYRDAEADIRELDKISHDGFTGFNADEGNHLPH